MKKYINIKLVCLLTVFSILNISFGQDAAAVAPSKGIIFSDTNFILTIIAAFLAIVIIALSNNLLSFVKYLLKNKTLILLIATFPLFSFTTATKGDISQHDTISYILMVIILLEFIYIMYIAYIFNNLLDKNTAEATSEEKTTTIFSKIWAKFNNFQPIEKENEIDSGHDYDGIHELDNPIPVWFSTAFVLCILFAIVYLWVYHVSESAPMQIAEYNKSVEIAEQKKNQQMATMGDQVDENTVTLLGDADIAKGKEIFVGRCATCHGEAGNSSTNGIGPNLSDNFWLHGNDIKDIFKTIKYGYEEKGMVAWEKNLSAQQIAQVASFVKSLDGKNIPNGKAPQGEKSL